MPSSLSPSVRSTEQLNAQIPGAFPDAPSPSIASITTHQTSLSRALYERRAEFTRQRNVRIKVGTWNTAAQKGTEHDVGAWFVKGKGVEEAMAGLGVADPDQLSGQGERESAASQEARHETATCTIPHRDLGSVPGGEEVDIYVLGLQEIVDITSATEALRPYTDPSAANRWKASLEAALPKGYRMVAEQQLIGLWLVIYASPEIFPHIRNVSTTSVGTGLMGYMGNKGAVTSRIVLGETTRLVFINSHLAAGADTASLERRNWDAAQITTRTRFEPIVDSLGSSQAQGEGLGDEEFAFWFGDLNYRLEGMPGDDVRRLFTIHTKDLDKDEGRPSTSGDSGYGSKSAMELDSVPLPPELDPASLQTTIASLLPHDELHQQMKKGKAFHDGWEEGPIRFLPSYKYDVGTVGVFDSSEKRRCPSWCDRILYRTRAAKQRYEAKAKEQEAARKKDEDMRAKGMDLAGDEDILFDYDPETDGENLPGAYEEYEEDEDPAPEQVTTKDGLTDEILLEYYTSHMRVLSSDHKPLDAVFSLKYDAVVPDLKAGVYAEVVRELDRQENEGRPSIAVVVDRATSSASSDDSNQTNSTFEGVDFDDVKFAKSKRRAITIANTGRVPATFGFADRPVDQDQNSGPFPSWLSVTFDKEPDKRDRPSPDDVHERYTLAPAEVINAELKLKIESVSLVRTLNEGAQLLEDVLVIRVENGRDHFLPLRAHWLPSVLARTVDKLIKIPEGGIRKLQHQIPDRDEVKWSVPREIFRLTEAIENMTERTLAEWDMTKSEGEKAPFKDNAGWPFITTQTFSHEPENETEETQLAALYDALDTDTPFPPCFFPTTTPSQKLHLLSQVLLTLLSSLLDGIIPPPLWSQLSQSLPTRPKNTLSPNPDDEKLTALEILATSPPHNATFLLLISFLQNLSTQISDAAKSSHASHTAEELPASPNVKVRRRTLSKVHDVAVKQLIVRNYASIFAGVVMRGDEGREREKEKERERMVGFLELFLGSGEDVMSW